MPVYLDFTRISKVLTGNLMLACSLVTITASIIAGGVSDFFAVRSRNPVRSRSFVLAGGYGLSAAAAVLFTLIPKDHFGLLAFAVCLMVFGSSWAAGVFWALPSLLFTREATLGVAAFCSGASNIVNPLAPFVTGVLLGSAGHWALGWLVCGIISLVSLGAALTVSGEKPVVLKR
jgi:hypothetical protein